MKSFVKKKGLERYWVSGGKKTFIRITSLLILFFFLGNNLKLCANSFFFSSFFSLIFFFYLIFQILGLERILSVCVSFLEIHILLLKHKILDLSPNRRHTLSIFLTPFHHHSLFSFSSFGYKLHPSFLFLKKCNKSEHDGIEYEKGRETGEKSRKREKQERKVERERNRREK